MWHPKEEGALPNMGLLSIMELCRLLVNYLKFDIHRAFAHQFVYHSSFVQHGVANQNVFTPCRAFDHQALLYGFQNIYSIRSFSLPPLGVAHHRALPSNAEILCPMQRFWFLPNTVRFLFNMRPKPT